MIEKSKIFSDSTYRFESEIGSGGGGIVYKVWHKRLQKYVIIKELKHGSKNDIETQRNEVEALKNVKSAYLPQVLDFITENDRVFTVMEFIEGESLDKAIERGEKFSQTQIVKWYGQLASALEVIHKNNIAHRDIKPANIMLLPNGDVCLIDFNAALVSGNDVRLISRSLGYASPEQYDIYERYKNTLNSPINYGSSSINVAPLDDTKTELLVEAESTEILGDDLEITETLSKNIDRQNAELTSKSVTEIIDWELSDIYSLGSTMYHLLSGIHPSERAKEVIPLSEIGRFSEGIIYVIEQSMSLNPSERFSSIEVLSDAIKNIHKNDRRWRVSQIKKIAAIILLPFLFALFAGTTIFGRNVMAQEKEERYYTTVYEIKNGPNPKESYDEALAMFWDRIDPYLAMAERLWEDGDLVACREYIEANLGNIAEFQVSPDAVRSFGDIYYILGNCYYYQSGEPDYINAKNNFEISVQFVKDNPIYYRDYAILLARTGNIQEAEQVLEKAQVLNLDDNSFNLLCGEINYAKKEYDTALDNFKNVILNSSDDYMRYRAYYTSDDILKLQGKPERSVALLSEGLNKIPTNRIPEMKERLADAYVKCKEYDKAIALFEQLADTGVPQFHILNNLVILLQNENLFERASDLLNKMADLFPNDYRITMRQAYLEADRQSKIQNENRDYSLTKLYYDAATKLYNKNVKPGASDAEMQQLDSIIEQLKSNKWID